MYSLSAKDNRLNLYSEQDALDVIASGLPACIFVPDDMHPEFFDLSNGIAGQVFQKFTNYNFQVAIVIPLSHGYGERIAELIRDHRSHPFVRFFESAEEAYAWLGRGV